VAFPEFRCHRPVGAKTFHIAQSLEISISSVIPAIISNRIFFLPCSIAHPEHLNRFGLSTLVISAMADTPNRGIVVISGGSAANNLVDVFDAVRDSKNCLLSYIIPISDNGGSSSELIRIFGGPGIGDVRSRLLDTRHPARTLLKGIFG
jgi:hypothetical protein